LPTTKTSQSTIRTATSHNPAPLSQKPPHLQNDRSAKQPVGRGEDHPPHIPS